MDIRWLRWLKRLLCLSVLVLLVACQPLHPVQPYATPLPTPVARLMIVTPEPASRGIVPVSPLPTPTRLAFTSPLPVPGSRGVAVMRYRVFMPHVATAKPPTPPTPMPCFTSSEAATVAALLLTDGRQQREFFSCNQALVRAADARAHDLAQNGYFAHCDLQGVCPNTYARNAGCKLPSDYSANGNNIEALIGGVANPVQVIDALSKSNAHSDLIFGRNSFFVKQHAVGIGFVADPNSKYKFYYSILFAICE